MLDETNIKCQQYLFVLYSSVISKYISISFGNTYNIYVIFQSLNHVLITIVYNYLLCFHCLKQIRNVFVICFDLEINKIYF